MGMRHRIGRRGDCPRWNRRRRGWWIAPGIAFTASLVVFGFTRRKTLRRLRDRYHTALDRGYEQPAYTYSAAFGPDYLDVVLDGIIYERVSFATIDRVELHGDLAEIWGRVDRSAWMVCPRALLNGSGMDRLRSAGVRMEIAQ
ncbi:MAG: hypothetical protein QM728_05830 [Gordonia sp. (in: high G+C Gram-positive bacteria)]|uniref:hypothetical protein n=1 Tax=Gordonia sp. (in: high G+C Gram-positive bacteria) TaxID=84139 RepID=UPI0039E6AFF2